MITIAENIHQMAVKAGPRSTSPFKAGDNIPGAGPDILGAQREVAECR